MIETIDKLKEIELNPDFKISKSFLKIIEKEIYCLMLEIKNTTIDKEIVKNIEILEEYQLHLMKLYSLDRVVLNDFLYEFIFDFDRIDENYQLNVVLEKIKFDSYKIK